MSNTKDLKGAIFGSMNDILNGGGQTVEARREAQREKAKAQAAAERMEEERARQTPPSKVGRGRPKAGDDSVLRKENRARTSLNLNKDLYDKIRGIAYTERLSVTQVMLIMMRKGCEAYDKNPAWLMK